MKTHFFQYVLLSVLICKHIHKNTPPSARPTCRYEGSWVNDQRHGHGVYHYASGAVYDGLWEHGKMHGMGSYTSATGSRYEGMYR